MGDIPLCFRGFMSISSFSLEKLISCAGNPQANALDIPHCLSHRIGYPNMWLACLATRLVFEYVTLTRAKVSVENARDSTNSDKLQGLVTNNAQSA